MSRKVILFLGPSAGILLLLFVTALLFALPENGKASSFNPEQKAKLANPAPGAKSDIITEFNLPKGDSNFGAAGGFSPPELTVPKFEDVPLAARVGDLTATATLGILNGPCSTSLQFTFDFFNASTNTGDTIKPPPVIDPNTGEPTPDRLAILASDANGNGVRDGIEKYPSFLNNLFQDANGNPIKPRARYMGYTSPSPYRSDVSLTVVLQTLIFEPGTKLSPSYDFDPRLGYPTVSVLLDPSAAATKTPVTDFCSPLLSASTTYGVSKDNQITSANEAGATVRKNPNGNATLNFVTFATSQRDADNDGYENFFDTCPFQPNKDGDPRNPASNPDLDGIDSACDPDPGVACWPGAPGGEGQSLDCDGDGWLNRGDNCPLKANVNQADDDIPEGGTVPDGGSRSDQIGDVCDKNPNSPDGHFHAVCKVKQVNVGAGGTPAIDPLAVRPCDPDAPLGTAAGEQTPPPGGETPPPGGETPPPGTTATPVPTVLGEQNPGEPGAAGGPGTGVGALAPAVASIPAWGAIATGLGGTGLLSLAASAIAGLFRRRR
ncbi:MAG: thrombospondin type 3 repeat-containing protein [Chloroflexi bacterium]|nr:thrombospondin type 3 repeat-containing protein [Chloroflexota bacterium]